jgi:hypothetical protein
MVTRKQIAEAGVASNGRPLVHPPTPDAPDASLSSWRSGGPYTGRGCEHGWAVRRQDHCCILFV